MPPTHNSPPVDPPQANSAPADSAPADSAPAALDIPTASWQRGRPTPGERRFRRLLVGLGLMLAFGLGLAYVYCAPFRHPQVHVLVLSGEVDAGLWPQKLPTIRPSPAAPALFDALRSWTEAAKLPTPRSIPGLGGGQTLDGLFQLATDPQIRDDDVALCVVQTQVATLDDAVFLVDRLDPTDPLRGRVPFVKFCDAFRAARAGIRLLCLDAGQLNADPRGGMSGNGFAAPLRRAVEATGDSNLWVLVSHGSGQQSQAAEGSVPTVFLDAVVRGLRSEADQNNDRRITLAELVEFVRRETAEFQRASGLPTEAQTPWLIRGGDLQPSSSREMSMTLAPASSSAKQAAALSPTPPPSASETPAGPLQKSVATSQRSATPENSDGAASPAAPSTTSTGSARPVDGMTVPELLAEAWELRDALERRESSMADEATLRPCDYAPCHWSRLLAELVQVEAVWSSQPRGVPPRVDALLRMRVNDLRTLSGKSQSLGSDWLQDVRRLHPRTEGDVAAPLSLALTECWQRWTNRPLSAADTQERTVLQGLQEATDGKPLAEFLASKPQNPHGELQFVKRLASRAELDWPRIRQALRVRRLAEEVSCRPVAIRWFDAELRHADRLRWYGERKLFDAVRPDDATTAKQSLADAESVYRQLAESTDRLVSARLLQADLLSALPHWLALSRNHALAIRPSLRRELPPLIAELGELTEGLANARSDECGRVEQLRRELLYRQKRVHGVVFPEALLGQIGLTERSSGEMRLLAQALLETPLPTASQRQALRKTLATPDSRGVTNSSLVSRAVTAIEGEPALVPVEPDHDLEAAYVRLLRPLERQNSADGRVRWTLGAARVVDAKDSNEIDRRSATDARRAAWLRSHIAFPGELSMSGARGGSDFAAATAAAWAHALPLVDPRDEIPSNVESGRSTLLREAMACVIRWQWREAMLAQSDAPAGEHVVLQARIDALKALLSNSFGEGATSRPSDAFVVIAPEAIDLDSAAERAISIVVRNPRSDARRVRYVVEHDPALLEVDTESENCQLTSKSPRVEFRMAPYDADSASVSSRALAAGGQDELRLTLRGRLAEEPTRLVVHVVAEESTVRREIAVRLPALPLALVEATASHSPALAATEGELRPFANRTTTYNLALRGTRRQSGKMEIVAYRLNASPATWPVAATLPATEVQHWLSRTTDIQPVGTIADVSVAEGATIPLKFPAVKADGKTSLDLPGGLLVVMTDAARGISTWQHLPCAPLRPAAYVEADVNYDAGREQLRINVRPREGAAPPDAGIPIRCRVVEIPDRGRSGPLRLESASARSLDAVLQGDRRDVALTLPFRRPTGAAYVLIDVDDWPRAFVFAIEADGARLATETAVEILEPTRRSAVRAPVEAIPATIAVTLPTQSVGEIVEVGLDRNGDRRLDGEPTVRLPADRQSTVTLDSIDAGGAWTLRTTVRDWSISIPARGLADQWATVLARVARGSQEVWSDGTPITFDKTGPELSRVTLSIDGEPTIGQPLRLTVRADDRGLSGVAGVSAGIDPSGLGVISARTKLVEATAGSDGSWSVEVPTENLVPGPSVVVIQATDLVGNAGPMKVVPIRLLSPEQAAAKLAARTAPLTGTVQYAGESVPEAEVRLTPAPEKGAEGTAVERPPLTTQTNRQGQFAFDAVSPGQYELTAKGTLRGFRYESRTAVTVAPTKEPGPIRLVFGKKDK